MLIRLSLTLIISQVVIIWWIKIDTQPANDHLDDNQCKLC